MEPNLTIGELAARTSCKIQTIRYYEQIGLMRNASRTTGNQRRFGQQHLERLAFIRHSRELGFSLEAIRELLNLADEPDRSCAAVDRIARRQLQQVESRIARLQALAIEFKRMIRRCRGGRIAECRIIEALADHAHCSTEHPVEATQPRRRARPSTPSRAGHDPTNEIRLKTRNDLLK